MPAKLGQCRGLVDSVGKREPHSYVVLSSPRMLKFVPPLEEMLILVLPFAGP